MEKDNILKPASFLFVITAVVAVINFSYNVIMSRMLTVSDFGDLRALFSIIMILVVPMAAIQTMLAKYTTEYYKANLGKLKSLSLHTLGLMLILGVIFVAIFGIFRNFISDYFKVSSATLVVLLGPLMLLLLIQPVILGIYQGLQRFGLLAANILSSTILKLSLGVMFVYWGLATLGAFYGIILSGILVVLTFGLMLIFLFSRQQTVKDTYNKQEIYSYSGYALGVLICFSLISQIDILIVKHKFLPEDAGLYAAAAVIGKAFLFLPVPVVTVLFPRVVENNKNGKSSLSILMQSLLISGLLCIIGISICFFFPHYLIKIFGNKYAQAVHLLKVFGLAMSPLALFYVLMNYFLSEYRLKFFYYCLLVCVLGIALLFSLPKTLIQFLSVLGWYGLIIFILPLIYILIKEKKVACKLA
ncbi:MAG: oligosaccharide flippase family protein [Omnitrophica bacterium]|nr:oligosaccharide flippase family protein [Candidatus Omnitrophota bacterium]